MKRKHRTHQPCERELSDKKLGGLLITSDFFQCTHAGSKTPFWTSCCSPRRTTGTTSRLSALWGQRFSPRCFCGPTNNFAHFRVLAACHFLQARRQVAVRPVTRARGNGAFRGALLVGKARARFLRLWILLNRIVSMMRFRKLMFGCCDRKKRRSAGAMGDLLRPRPQWRGAAYRNERRSGARSYLQ
jgi:hypothetical protein